METNKPVLDLIRNYVRDAAQVVAALRTSFGCRNLTAAVTNTVIPRVGTIHSEPLGTISYHFHGRGCLVSVDPLKIDIELCGDSDIIGFDAWRLYRYASETLGWGEIDPDEMQAELDQLCNKQLIHFSRESPLFGLYYQSSDEYILSTSRS